VAVLLNISPDHLDRHGGLAGYVAVKRRVFAGQGAAETAIIGIDDPHCAAIYEDLVAQGRQQVVPIAVGRLVEGGVCVVDGELHDLRGAGGRVADLGSALCLPGAHNWQNAAASYTVARVLGLETEEIVAAIMSFPGLVHRMERIAEINGIAYVNDSKGTNADAAARALSSYENVYWIAGGRAKEGGIAALQAYFPRIRHAYLIGEAAEDFAATLDGKVPHTVSGDLAAAVKAASRQAERDAIPGAVVLMSPACASFDQFANFEIRGEAFRELVTELQEHAA
jgi:UDP-N-acetylmuramoylalanine--D-glutamate ligase